jgi:hypothetical protein
MVQTCRCITNVEKYSRNDNIRCVKSAPLSEFFAGIKKSSKKLRNIENKINLAESNVSDSRSVATFCRLIDCAVPVENLLRKWIGAWNWSFLGNDLRQFMFNCRFNSLPLNNRLNAYIAEVDPHCTFCRILDRATTTRDSFKHCFFDCLTIRQMLTFIINNMTTGISMEDDNFIECYWFGIINGEVNIPILVFFF